MLKSKLNEISKEEKHLLDFQGIEDYMNVSQIIKNQLTL
jgi:hypothetical protein